MTISSSGVPAEWTAQLKRGVLELVILRLLSSHSSHGYALIGRLTALGPLAAGENTVYPLLRRLKRDGALETCAEESPAGPPRQRYRVTAHGEALLSSLEGEWKAVLEAMTKTQGPGVS